MSFTVGRVLGDAWALWRARRDLLARVAAPFLFLPDYAMKLLAPLPAPSAAADADRWLALKEQLDFIGDHAPALLLAGALSQLGIAVLTVLLLDPAAETAGDALRRGAALWPRFVIATLLIGIPATLGLPLIFPALLLLGRTVAAGPAIAAEQPIGAVRAIGRSFALTRGRTLTVSALAGATLATRLVAPWPFMSMDLYLRDLNTPNPVALSVIDAAAAGADMLAEIAAVLVAVAAYRALAAGASRGI